MPDCPHCNGPLLKGLNGRIPVLYCHPCQRSFEAHTLEEAYDEEAQLVQAIRTALQADGYIVERVGQHRADKAGTDPGVADLLVSRHDWLPYTCAQMEVKLPSQQQKQSAEQRQKAEDGRLAIVTSVREAKEIADAVSRRLRRLALIMD